MIYRKGQILYITVTLLLQQNIKNFIHYFVMSKLTLNSASFKLMFINMLTSQIKSNIYLKKQNLFHYDQEIIFV